MTAIMKTIIREVEELEGYIGEMGKEELVKEQRLLKEALVTIDTLVERLFTLRQGLEGAKRVNNELLMDIE